MPAVLFDLDGVLVDSRAAITGCLDHALSENGFPRRGPQILERFIGPPLSEAFCKLIGSNESDPMIRACIASYRKRYAVDSIEKTKVIPGIVGALEDLQTGHRLAVATSKPLAFAEPLIGHLGIRPYFSAVIGPGLNPQGGDKAAIIGKALSVLGTPETAVMVGDRLHDVLGAHANGIPCIGVGWGIGSRRELLQAGADRLVERPAELAVAVEAEDPRRRPR